MVTVLQMILLLTIITWNKCLPTTGLVNVDLKIKLQSIIGNLYKWSREKGQSMYTKQALF